jgi:hypothetical protein
MSDDQCEECVVDIPVYRGRWDDLAILEKVCADCIDDIELQSR